MVTKPFEWSVNRRYSDFDWLRKLLTLINKINNNENSIMYILLTTLYESIIFIYYNYHIL